MPPPHFRVYIFLATWHKLQIVINLKKLRHLIVFIANFYDKILNAYNPVWEQILFYV